ncbi:uncharacterized protein RJT20DRAFT_54214 [Scheffersomyces xylosifermentans]|uniref:uncharacterized protein n=1 Tax=Scheffersomyces xylosifermentans TaxID=1304137 RepID=UPI00315DB268
MTFTSETLHYKAYTSSYNADPITLKDYTLKLHKQADGTYGAHPDKVLIKVHAVSLNPVDAKLHHIAHYPVKFLNAHQGTGRDYSGTVVSIGEKAKSHFGLSEGDKVQGFFIHPFGPGTLSEYIELNYKDKSDQSVGKVPKNISFTEAASWPLVFGTAYTATGYSDLKDKKVLILGGNTSVGKYSIQLAHLYGAKEVVVTCSERSKPLVQKLGATSVIDYTKHKSLVNPLLGCVQESGFYDYIIDTVGGNELFPHLQHILKSEGAHYATIVGDTDRVDLSWPVIKSGFSIASRLICGYLGRSFYQYHLFLTAGGKDWVQKGVELIESEKIGIFIDSTYKFSEFHKAFEKLESGKASGKIIVTVEDEE